MNKLMEHWFSYSVILIWVVVCIISQKVDLVSVYANKGLDCINHEYHRFCSSLSLHNNFIHVIANVTALYWIGQFLEPQIYPAKLLIFSLLAGVITNIVFSAIFCNATGIGGSPIVFALIGLVISLQLMKVDTVKFQLGTWYGNWILGYAVLSNVPFFSDNFASTLFIHVFSMVLGILFGCLCVGAKIF